MNTILSRVSYNYFIYRSVQHPNILSLYWELLSKIHEHNFKSCFLFYIYIGVYSIPTYSHYTGSYYPRDEAPNHHQLSQWQKSAYANF